MSSQIKLLVLLVFLLPALRSSAAPHTSEEAMIFAGYVQPSELGGFVATPVSMTVQKGRSVQALIRYRSPQSTEPMSFQQACAYFERAGWHSDTSLMQGSSAAFSRGPFPGEPPACHYHADIRTDGARLYITYRSIE